MRYLLTRSVTLFLATPVFAEDTILAQAANAFVRQSRLRRAIHVLRSHLVNAAERAPDG